MAKEDKVKSKELDTDRIMAYVIENFPHAVRRAFKNGDSQTDLVMHILETTAPPSGMATWKGNITNLDLENEAFTS